MNDSELITAVKESVTGVHMSRRSRSSAVAARYAPGAGFPAWLEFADHPWFIGVQFHPELESRPFEPHPLFASTIAAAGTEPIGVAACTRLVRDNWNCRVRVLCQIRRSSGKS